MNFNLFWNVVPVLYLFHQTNVGPYLNIGFCILFQSKLSGRLSLYQLNLNIRFYCLSNGTHSINSRADRQYYRHYTKCLFKSIDIKQFIIVHSFENCKAFLLFKVTGLQVTTDQTEGLGGGPAQGWALSDNDWNDSQIMRALSIFHCFDFVVFLTLLGTHAACFKPSRL